MLKNPIHNKLLKVLGFLLLAVSIFYLVRVVSNLELSFYDLLLMAKNNPLGLILCALFYVLTFALGSFIWTLWVIKLGARSNQKKSGYLVLMAVYFYTNLQKYIPGNFLQFVGRNLKGNQYGYSHKSLFSASFIEIIVSIGSGLIFVLLMTPFFWGEAQKIVAYLSMGTMVFVGFAFVLVALLLMIGFYRSKFFTDNNIIYQLHKYSKIIYISIFAFLITFALFGLINLLLFNSFFNLAFTLKNFAILSFGFTISWLVGFVIPGSPGGIVVREAVFVLILNGLIAEKELIYVIIFIRLLGVALEVLLFFIAWLFLLSFKRLWSDIVS